MGELQPLPIETWVSTAQADVDAQSEAGEGVETAMGGPWPDDGFERCFLVARRPFPESVNAGIRERMRAASSS